ncbi:MAG: DUF5691 domain-containing protein [Pseudomonadota bacterium]
MRDLEAGMAGIKGRWMIGGSALEEAPADWRAVVSEDAEPDLALLSIAGQAAQIVFRPAPVARIEEAATLPRLSVPTLPDRLRQQFRRLVQMQKPTADQMSMVLTLMAGRGWTVHPADWMPTSTDALPDCYAPWAGWRDRIETDDHDTLTAENWASWPAAERRHALEAMRRVDPAAGRALIEAQAPALPAEQRLRVIQCMAEGLSGEDSAFLEGLAADRSAKIRMLAAQLLSRLGWIGDETAAQELAGFFTVASAGILRKGRVVTPNKLKTEAQRRRRDTLFDTVSLAGLAQSLGVDEAALPAMWSDKDPRALPDFAEMVARTGSDAAIRACLERYLNFADIDARLLTPLVLRLPNAERSRALPEVLKRDNAALSATISCAEGNLGTIALGAFQLSGKLSALGDAITAHADDASSRRANPTLQAGLFNLGLLADAAAARSLVQRFVGIGMIGADPLLAMLAFNGALTPGDE